MAIFHFSAKVISRAAGSSALAAAAYRSASRLQDQRLDRHHDFSNKAGVIHSEVMLPDGAPEEWRDREKLWNAVETAEVRKDAQLAREVEFAIPRELDQAEGIRLARDFVAREFVSHGMVADLNVHWDVSSDGEPKPHAHVMLSMREIGEDGFGAKVRGWNRTELLERWREDWADHVNERLASLDIDARVDHRSLEMLGIELEPQNKIGPAASRMAAKGLELERVDEHREIARCNGEKIVKRPALALEAITHQQATFTTRDLARFVHRHSEGKEQFDRVFAAAKAAPELVALGKDGRGEERFTSRDMIETEQRLERATSAMAERVCNAVRAQDRERALTAAEKRGMILSTEQRTAFEHATDGRDLSVIVGYAGTGKSATLGVAREAWEHAGYRVQGLTLSGIAAENLERGSGIASRTIASIEHQWPRGREQLGPSDVLVIDEAGMIGSRQMERVVAQAEKHGAKLVLVGDPEQLQAIEAGAAFRSIAERHGSVEITDIRRQREQWQRDATRQLATGRTGDAIAAYNSAGNVHAAGSRDAARAALIERWDAERQAAPEASRAILTHTREEVQTLNEQARARLAASGELGPEVTLAAERGRRQFAPGDRIMFLKNERSLGVKNGNLGRVESVSSARMAVMLDDGRAVAFDLKDYNQLDHGYAATIHKAQGVTVDRVHVLATPGLDRHAAYVALSRHRESVQLHYGADDFADQAKLVRTLSRERQKDMASDYARDPDASPERIFAERREIQVPSSRPRQPPQKPALSPAPDPFADLDLRPQSAALTRGPERPQFQTSQTSIAPLGLEAAVQRYARATADIMRMRKDGYSELPHQKIAFDKAAQALNATRPNAAGDLRNAFVRDMELIDQAAQGRTRAAIGAMMLEAELRTSPERRAERFVQDWQRLAKAHRSLSDAGDRVGARTIGQQMIGMGKSIERDAQAESLVRRSLPELGLKAGAGVSLSHGIREYLGLSRGRGISI